MPNVQILFIFSQFSAALLAPSLVLLLVGLFIRFLASVGCAFACFGPVSQERAFLGFSLLPKGTLQAALVPGLYHFAIERSGGNDSNAGPLSLQTCLLALLLCAPLGELAIRLLGPMLLRQKLLSTAGISAGGGAPVGSTILPLLAAAKGRVTHSDWKGRLRVRLDAPCVVFDLGRRFRPFGNFEKFVRFSP